MLTTVEGQDSYATGDEESSLPGLGWQQWRYAAIVAGLTVGLCLFATFLLPQLLGDPQWLTLGDAKWTIQSAQYVANGGLGAVYSVNIQFLPLPGFLLVLAPFAALGNRLGLVNGYPIPLLHPSMLLVMAPVFFICGATAVLGVDYLADTLHVSRLRRRILALAVALFVVAPTCCWAGHPEDLLSLALSCLSLALLLRRRYLGSAVVLSVAIMMQPWALLLIPLVAVASPTRLRIRSVVYSSAVPALTGLLLLALDWKDAFRSLVIQPMQGNGQHLPWWSLSHSMTAIQSSAPVVVRVGSGPRAFAVLIAIAAAWRIRKDVRPATIMLVASIALTARAVFETQVWCYYLGPAAVFLALGAATAPETKRWVAGAATALVFYGFVAGGYDAYSMPSSLALGVLTACALGSLAAARERRIPDGLTLELQPVT
jgi:hypothetical protein